MRILVTGAAGQIGSNIIRELNAQGHTDIVAVDMLLADDQWKNLRGLRFKEYFDAENHPLERQENGEFFPFDAVIHMGAIVATNEKDARKMLQANYEEAKFYSSLAPRFIYASSSTTYGLGEQGMDDTKPIDDLKPLNPYAYAKHLFDLWCEGNAPLGIGLKFFNVFGPGEEHKGDMASIIRKGWGAMHRGLTPLQIFKGDRPITRDLIYVKDVAKIVVYCARNQIPGGLYNVGSGSPQSFEHFLDLLGCPYEYGLPSPALKGAYQYETCANMAKLRATGYDSPLTPLKDAIAESVAYWDAQ